MNIDEMISKALEEEFEERVEQSLNDTKKHRFSLSYRLWERKMLRDFRRNRVDKKWTLKRARTVVVSGIAAASVMVGVAAFAAVEIGRYGFEDKQEYSKLFIENHPSDKSTFEEYYGLPEEDGWEIEYFSSDAYSVLISYKRGEQIVSFSQEIIRGNMGIVNTEDAQVEPMSIYEENDGFFIQFKGGGRGLWWIYDGYLFSFVGNLNKNELVDLAYSTKIVDFSNYF